MQRYRERDDSSVHHIEDLAAEIERCKRMLEDEELTPIEVPHPTIRP